MEKKSKKSVEEILEALPTKEDLIEYTKKELNNIEIGLTHALKIVMEANIWK